MAAAAAPTGGKAVGGEEIKASGLCKPDLASTLGGAFPASLASGGTLHRSSLANETDQATKQTHPTLEKPG